MWPIVSVILKGKIISSTSGLPLLLYKIAMVDWTHICHSYLLNKSYQNNGSINLTGVKRTDSNSDACMCKLYLPTKSLPGLAFYYLSQPCSHWLLSLLDWIHVTTSCAVFINVQYLVQSSFTLTDLHMFRIGFLKLLCLFSCFIH